MKTIKSKIDLSANSTSTIPAEAEINTANGVNNKLLVALAYCTDTPIYSKEVEFDGKKYLRYYFDSAAVAKLFTDLGMQ